MRVAHPSLDTFFIGTRMRVAHPNQNAILDHNASPNQKTQNQPNL
jgi:hypothetical protein